MKSTELSRARSAATMPSRDSPQGLVRCAQCGARDDRNFTPFGRDKTSGYIIAGLAEAATDLCPRQPIRAQDHSGIVARAPGRRGTVSGLAFRATRSRFVILPFRHPHLVSVRLQDGSRLGSALPVPVQVPACAGRRKQDSDFVAARRASATRWGWPSTLDGLLSQGAVRATGGWPGGACEPSPAQPDFAARYILPRFRNSCSNTATGAVRILCSNAMFVAVARHNPDWGKTAAARSNSAAEPVRAAPARKNKTQLVPIISTPTADRGSLARWPPLPAIRLFDLASSAPPGIVLQHTPGLLLTRPEGVLLFCRFPGRRLLRRVKNLQILSSALSPGW